MAEELGLASMASQLAQHYHQKDSHCPKKLIIIRFFLWAIGVHFHSAVVASNSATQVAQNIVGLVTTLLCAICQLLN